MSSEASGPTGSDDLSILGRVVIIGVGAVGTALARALSARGAQVVAVAGRTPERVHNAQALVSLLPGAVHVLSAEQATYAGDTVFLAVPDDAIGPVARAMRWRAGQVAAHLCGSQGADVLGFVRTEGALPAALHPLMTFPRPDLSEPIDVLLRRLAGATWALETEDASVQARLETLVAALGGRTLFLAGEARVPYHIAAVFAANYVVALLGGSAALWEAFGASAADALPALLPLLRAAVERLASDGLPSALSGPVARGDANTVAVHLAWLAEHANDSPDLERVRAVYLAMAELSLPIATAKGTLTPERADSLRALLGANAHHEGVPPQSERGAGQ